MALGRKIRKLVRTPRGFVEDSWLGQAASRARVASAVALSHVGVRLQEERELRALNGILEQGSRYFDLVQRSERQRSVAVLESQFFAIVQELQPMLFVEAGAKDAGTARRARQHLPDASILAFEANPQTYRRFEFAVGIHNRAHGVDYRHCALTDAAGKVVINVRKGSRGEAMADGQASLLKHANYALGHEEVLVDATTLDLVWEAEGSPRCALWVDVEGAIREVLAGGRSMLGHAAVVFVEVEEREIWLGQWTVKDVDHCMYEAGLLPVARDFQSGAQHNVVYLRPTRSAMRALVQARQVSPHAMTRSGTALFDWCLARHLARD